MFLEIQICHFLYKLVIFRGGVKIQICHFLYKLIIVGGMVKFKEKYPRPFFFRITKNDVVCEKNIQKNIQIPWVSKYGQK